MSDLTAITGLHDMHPGRILRPVGGPQPLTAQTIGGRIREARKQAHLSQTALADRLGLKQARVSDWECGKFKPERDNLASLAAALGRTMAELMPGPSDQPRHSPPVQAQAPPSGKGGAYAADRAQAGLLEDDEREFYRAVIRELRDQAAVIVSTAEAALRGKEDGSTRGAATTRRGARRKHHRRAS